MRLFVRRRENRVVMSVPVELVVGGTRLRAVSQDVSTSGMFVRLAQPLPVGTDLEVTLSIEAQQLTTFATVVHVLSEIEGRTLGRRPGIGLCFHAAEDLDALSTTFRTTLAELISVHPQQVAHAEDIRIVVADGSTRLLERMSTALGNAGFAVATASNGMEALSACLRRVPDAVLADRDLPVVDGLALLEEMGRYPELAAVPVMLMAEDAGDLARLAAFQHGAMDFIPKPFTVLEVILRTRRLVRAARQETERVMLRGVLTELGLPSLLTMLEQDRKSGNLMLTRNEIIAWIAFSQGRIVRARSSEPAPDARSVLMSVLDWSDGYFELSSGAPVDSAEIDESVTHLLLEHARRRDEAARS
jgi:DNA-binding response OmpR family regulator